MSATGSASIENLLKLAHALGRLDDFAALLAPPPAATLADSEARAASAAPQRKRGTR